MASWDDMATADPELAVAARELLSVPGVGFGYLATVRRDGAPRIHPINVVWAGGRLEAFIVPSPKLDDLRRDCRFALHSTGSEDVDDELEIGGHAREIKDAACRAEAIAACPFRPGDDHALVELDLDRVLWGHYEPRGVFPPRYRIWRAAKASADSSAR